MFNMAHAFTVSLRRNGGAYKDAPVILTVGEDEYAPELTDGSIGWLARENVSVRLVPKYLYATRKYFGTGAYRMLADFKADVVLMVDSDIVIGQPFDELVESIAATGEFGALIEFGTPFYFENSPTWEQLYEHVGLGEPKKIHQYTGWGLMGQAIEHQFCPPWFNFGVVIAPRDIMLRIGRVFCPLVDRINELEESMYRSQLALSLAVVALNIPYRVLPLRYNFPYEDAVEADNPAEVENAAILHYARQTEQFNKWTDFRDMDRLYAAIRREGQTGILAKICAVLESIYPTLVDEQRGLDDRPFRLGKEWAGLGDPTKQPAAAAVESDDEVLVSAGEDE